MSSKKIGEKNERVMWGEDTPWKTESSFWTWVRGGLRRSLWMRHPVKILLLKEKRYRASIGRGGRSVWALRCSICQTEQPQSECEVDHIKEAGSLKSREDIAGFVERLAFVTTEDLRVVCKPCHKILTMMSRYGMTFEEAAQRKAEIAKRKKKK